MLEIKLGLIFQDRNSTKRYRCRGPELWSMVFGFDDIYCVYKWQMRAYLVASLCCGHAMQGWGSCKNIETYQGGSWGRCKREGHSNWGTYIARRILNAMLMIRVTFHIPPLAPPPGSPKRKDVWFVITSFQCAAGEDTDPASSSKPPPPPRPISLYSRT